MAPYKKLWMLFGLELLNLVAHRSLHYLSGAASWPDILSSAISLIIIFIMGWILGRSGARYGRVIFITVAFWFFSTTVAIVLTGLLAPIELDALKGYVLAMGLFLPIGLAIAAVAVATSRRVAA